MAYEEKSDNYITEYKVLRAKLIYKCVVRGVFMFEECSCECVYVMVQRTNINSWW